MMIFYLTIILYYNLVYCFPLQIITTIMLLYLLLGVSALVGVMTIIITYPLLAIINQRFTTIHRQLMAATDKRINAMNEVYIFLNIYLYFILYLFSYNFFFLF